MDLSMRPVSIAIMVFALMLAGLVFFTVPKLMTRNVEVVPPAPMPVIAGAEVIVAAHTVPAGTILKSDDLRWQRWPDEGLDANYLVRDKGANLQKDAVGRVVLRGITVGEPITAQRLLKPGDSGFLAAALTAGMRAMSIRIDAVSGNAGFITPGDRVDILLTEHYPMHYGPNDANAGGTMPPQKQVSSVLLRDVRVLAVDQEMRDLDNKPKVGSTATVEVDLEQAQKLNLASQMGALSLALRSLSRPEHPEVQGGLIQDVNVSAFLGSLSRRGRDDNGLRVYRGTAASLGR
jgi:pilus assembly protein CpaB